MNRPAHLGLSTSAKSADAAAKRQPHATLADRAAGRRSLNCLALASVICVLACTPGNTAFAAEENGNGDSDVAHTGVPLCMALPRVSIADGTPIVSAFSEVLREQVAAFVNGPLVEVRAMTSRLPVQVRAEAVKEKCAYLLNLSFAHHPQSKIGRRSADTAVTVGSAAASLGALSDTASGALGAASTLSSLLPSGDSGASGSGLYPVGKNDRVSLSYSLEPVGRKGNPLTGNFDAKAAKDNEPVVDAMVEKAASAIVEALGSEQESH